MHWIEQSRAQRTSKRIALAWWLAAGAPGCALESKSLGEDSSATGSGSGTTSDDTGTSSGGGESWPPAACDLDRSPFLDAECLAALRRACNEHTAETPCAGAESLAFDDGGYSIHCEWVEVIAFSDAATCAVESTTSRCEAQNESLGGCLSNCSAIPSELEIIVMCDGPLGPWAAVDSEEDDDFGGCAPNTQPPAPALCDCAPAACDVQ
jgi:hypothetical protein